MEIRFQCNGFYLNCKIGLLVLKSLFESMVSNIRQRVDWLDVLIVRNQDERHESALENFEKEKSCLVS
jgi:hypothetical protein